MLFRLLVLVSFMVKGLLNNNDTSSLKNAGYIAEAQNDFIFAVIGEELGFTGSCITIFFIVSDCSGVYNSSCESKKFLKED